MLFSVLQTTASGCKRSEVRKRAKISNRYNQALRLTQDIYGKVITSQLDIPNESQEVNPFQAGDHKALINRRTRKHNKNSTDIRNDSDLASVSSGVHQGTVLGPLLFSLNINDISTDIESEIRLFADDCACYCEIEEKEDTVKLNNDNDRLGGKTIGLSYCIKV